MTTRRSEASERPLTVDDLARIPDDGRRYELVDGRLDVSPAPSLIHSTVDTRLTYLLISLCPQGFRPYTGPGINFKADRTHHRIPDLAVIRTDDASTAGTHLNRPPVLAVEIVSPESVLRDANTKRVEYAKFGVESYWLLTSSLS
ncbi:Uma2 family endonuclease [Nocardiopsis oceani]